MGAVGATLAVSLNQHTLGWLDAGELSLAALLLGTAHPPGEAGWIVPAHLSAQLPLGDGVARLGGFSAVCHGITGGAVYGLAKGVRPSESAAEAAPLLGPAVAGLLYAGLGAALLQAVRPEVYALLATLGVLAMATAQLGGARGAAIAVAFMAFAATVHPLVVAAVLPAFLLLLLRPGAAALGTRRRAVFATATILILPALSLLALPILRLDPLATSSFGPEPGGSWWASLTGAGYAGSFRPSVAQVLSNVIEHLQLVIDELSLAGVLLAGVGATRLPPRDRLWMATMIVGAALPTVLQGPFSASNPDARGYLLLPLALLCVLAGLGAERVGLAALRVRARPVTLLPAAVAVAAVFGFAGVQRVGTHSASAAAPLARAALDVAPLGAVVLPAGDSWSFPVAYTAAWERRRSDLLVLPMGALRLDRARHMLGGRPELGPLWPRIEDELEARPFTKRETLLSLWARSAHGRPVRFTDVPLPPALWSQVGVDGPWLAVDPAPQGASIGGPARGRTFEDTLRRQCATKRDPRLPGVASRWIVQRLAWAVTAGDPRAVDPLDELARACVPEPWDVVFLAAHRAREALKPGGPPWGFAPTPAGTPPSVLFDTLRAATHLRPSDRALLAWLMVLDGRLSTAAHTAAEALAGEPSDPLALLVVGQLRSTGLVPKMESP